MADIHKPLMIVALMVMVVGIGFTLANAWFFFLSDPAALHTAPRAESESGNDVEVRITEVVALHLFGKPRATPGGAADVALTENLRETRLSLELVGVFVADEADASRALIAQKGRKPETYAPGERLPGNAKLVDVYWNLVVISRAGEHESLRFDHGPDGITRNEPAAGQARHEPDQSPVMESATPSPPPADAQAALARYREEFGRKPEQLLANIGVGLADDRNGYLVGALADLPELGHTGLQPGDRILSVNGRDVGDPGADLMKLEDLVADGAARLEIQRGERRFVVTVAVN